MNKVITINKKSRNVSFGDYYDSVYGEFMFRQVMCDVYMPNNEAVPIDVEKEQIKLVIEGFKKRKELYDEIRKEDVKGKSYYVISPTMRYDLEWLKEKPKLPSSKKPLNEAEAAVPASTATDASSTASQEAAQLEQESNKPASKPIEYTDARRKYLISKGFKFNEVTRNWETREFRFPDVKINASNSDEQFIEDMSRLINASYKNKRKK